MSRRGSLEKWRGVEWGPEIRTGYTHRWGISEWGLQGDPSLALRRVRPCLVVAAASSHKQAMHGWGGMGYEGVVGLTYLGLASRGKEGRSHGEEESCGGNLGHGRDSAVQRR